MATNATYLENIPVMPPPPGKYSDFDAPAEHATFTWVVLLLTTTIVFLAVAVRFYVKIFITKQKISWDDWACLVALCARIADDTIILEGFRYNLGKHLWNIRAISVSRKGLLLLNVRSVVGLVNAVCVRLAILGLYQKLFGVYRASLKLVYAGYAAVAIATLPELGLIIAWIMLCSDGYHEGYCSTKNISICLIYISSIWMLVDSYIYSIALSRLRKLQVKRQKRIQLMTLFGFGLIALAFAACLVVFAAISTRTTDQLYLALWTNIFKVLETNIALTCACATFFPAMWRGRTTASTSASSLYVAKSLEHTPASQPPSVSDEAKCSQRSDRPNSLDGR